jgi:putative PIN family toxin of toxin-antitoxin system
LDTSIVVATLRSRRGASHRLLELVAHGKVRPLVSTTLFLEYEDVLMRPETRLATKMDAANVEGFLAAFASAAEGVEVNFRWRPQLTDPNDELILEAAVNGAADALVTHNVRDFREAAPRFGLRVLLPREVLKEVEP